MVMTENTISTQKQVQSLLQAATVLCGMPVLLHDYLARTHLAAQWREHLSPPCLERKAVDQNTACSGYCGAGGEINHWIEQYPQGRVQPCRFGYWKIVVPLLSRRILTGVLHAGPYRGDPDDGDFAPQTCSAAAETHLEHCRIILAAVATEIERLIGPWQSLPEAEALRTSQILAYLHQQQGRAVRMEELAAHMHLSASRLRHIIHDVFGKSFSALSMELRLQRAAGLLTLTERSLAEVAARLGFCDQSHFAKAFRQHFGESPLHYRRRHQADFPNVKGKHRQGLSRQSG